MILTDCPDCAGADCPTYQEQRAPERTLATRVWVEPGVTPRDGSIHQLIRKSLEGSDLALDSDEFTVHALPGADGGTDHVALLANRELATVGAA